MEKQLILDKYEPLPLESLKIENNLLDVEKKLIFEEESQIPNLVISSNCPFNKNYCFYDIVLNVSTKENIFPKQKYYLKSQQIMELKPIDINSIFNDDTLNNNIVNTSDNNVKEKAINDDENSVHNKIISSIKSKNYKSYIPKNANIEKGEVGNIGNNVNLSDNEWYIIGNKNNNIPDGPYNDLQMYNKLYQIYYICLSKNEKFPNYLINEKKSDIFMTMDDCFEKLKTRLQYLKTVGIYSNNNQLANQNNFNLYNNILFYQSQMLPYYQMNNLFSLNNNNLNNNINKNNIPNKFDKSPNIQHQNNQNDKINNNNNNRDNNLKMDNNTRFHKNKGQNYINNNNNYKYKNTNYYKNRYNRKEKTSKNYQMKDNNYNNKDKANQIKKMMDSNFSHTNNELKEVGIANNSVQTTTNIDVESFFEKK